MKTIESLTISDKVYDKYGNHHTTLSIEKEGDFVEVKIKEKGTYVAKIGSTKCYRKDFNGIKTYLYFNKSDALQYKKQSLLKDLQYKKESILNEIKDLQKFREKHWDYLNEYCTDRHINKLKRLCN